MAINKVDYAGKTLIDLTKDTVTPNTLARGVTAHGANGEIITGTATILNYDLVGETTYRDGSLPTYGLE